MSKLKLSILLGLFPCAFAQDAWILNDFYKTNEKVEKHSKDKVHYKINSSLYHIDISGDEVREYIGTKIEDGIPHLTIYDSRKNIVFDEKFPISGFNSHIYRLKRRRISNNKVALLVYLFNGNTNYINTMGSASVWAMVVEDGKLENLVLKSFGNIWLENKDNYGLYKRAHQVEFKDINRDNQLDLIITSGSVFKAYSHLKNGKWAQTGNM